MKWNLGRIVGVCFMLFGGLLWLSIGLRQYNDSKQLAAHGKVTAGEVESTDGIVTWLPSARGFHLQVSFKTEDQTLHEERVRVNENVFTDVRIGDKIQVHYLPENPRALQVGDQVRLQYGGLFRAFLFFAAAGFFVWYFRNLGSAASRINKTMETLALEKYEYASVKPEDFKHLDLAYYNHIQQSLESRGFSHIDDRENVTLRQRGGANVFWRSMLSADQTIMASFYHLPKSMVRRLRGKSAKALDFTTRLSDGSFICTSNAPGASKFEYPPTIGQLFMAPGTASDALLDAHTRRVNKYLAAHPGAGAVVINGKEDIQRASEEIQRIKSEFRKQHGLSKLEMERISRLSGSEIDRLHDAVVEDRERGK